MSKKPSPAKTEEEQKLSIAQTDYRLGNFYEARKLAHSILGVKTNSALINNKALGILKMTSVDPLVLAVFFFSLIFSTVVAFLSAYK